MSKWFKETIRPTRKFKPYYVPGASGIEAVSPEGAKKFKTVYPAGVLVKGGDLFILSGQTAGPIYHDHPHKPEQWKEVPDDVKEQTAAILDQFKAILRMVGGDLNNIIMLRKYLTHMSEDFDKVFEVTEQYFKKYGEYRPASTTIEVKELVSPLVGKKLRIEMEAYAVIPKNN
jgi:enamine deaminase RidA (YjgF/YER057c/UK114 family)